MILRSFSVILHSPTTLCPSVCPQCVLCLSALGFINNKKKLFSLSVSAPFPAAFHVTTVSRWAAPLAPNAKSGTLRNLVLLFLAFVTHSIFDLSECLCCQKEV